MHLLGRLLLSRFTFGAAQLLLVVPLVLAVWQVGFRMFTKDDLHEEMDIVTGIAVIMIGLGVVLEERHVLREVFRLTGGAREAAEEAVDHLCHKYGAGQLVFGLFAAICIEAIKIPNTILYTGEVDDYLVIGGLFFVAMGAFLLARCGLVLLLSPPTTR